MYVSTVSSNGNGEVSIVKAIEGRERQVDEAADRPPCHSQTPGYSHQKLPHEVVAEQVSRQLGGLYELPGCYVHRVQMPVPDLLLQRQYVEESLTLEQEFHNPLLKNWEIQVKALSENGQDPRNPV